MLFLKSLLAHPFSLHILHHYLGLSRKTILKHLLCVYLILTSGLHHRGLFRLCGSAVRTRQLRQRSDCGERVDMEHEGDVPTVASLLKLFLRELPIAIVPEPQRKQLVLSLKGIYLI